MATMTSKSLGTSVSGRCVAAALIAACASTAHNFPGNSTMPLAGHVRLTGSSSGWCLLVLCNNRNLSFIMIIFYKDIDYRDNDM